jgi:hypothetical protein
MLPMPGDRAVGDRPGRVGGRLVVSWSGRGRPRCRRRGRSGQDRVGLRVVRDELRREAEHVDVCRLVDEHTASAIDMPMPPSRMPSSIVITRSCAAASAIIAGSSGAQQRASQTVTSMPSSASTQRPSRRSRASCRSATMHVARTGATLRALQPRADLVLAHLAGGAARIADRDRAGVDECRWRRAASVRAPVRSTVRARACPAPSTAAPCRTRRDGWRRRGR